MGTAEIVHPVAVEDVEGWMRTFMTTLLLDPHSPEFEQHVRNRRLNWEPERTWGAREHGRWVGTLASYERTVTVPGAGMGTHDLTADALTLVTVAATHRRQGLLTRMLSDSLRAAKERGDAISVLIAAEWPIYGRFGYSPATVGAEYRLHAGRPGARPAGSDPSTVRQVDPSEMATIAPGVFDTARRARAGQIDRRAPWWSRRLGLEGYSLPAGERVNLVVHEGPDGPDGTLAWRTTRGFELDGRLGRIEVTDLVAANDGAYRDLWGYLAGIDAVDRISVLHRPAEEAVRWLLDDGRTLQQTASLDFMWLRILDVPAALSARGYACAGDVVLDVVDDAPGGHGAGRVRLSAGTGGARCATTTDPPDLRIPQRALASMYLGAHRLAQLAILSEVEEITPGAVALIDLMFSTPLPPWTQTGF